MRRQSLVLLLLATAALAVLSSPVTTVTAQEPTLADVLALSAKYVSAYADPTRLIVGEERYKHDFLKFIMNISGSGEYLPQGGHQWTGELVIAASPGDEKNGLPWLEFRDILTLDGRPARDGVSRLGILATKPMAVAGPEAMKYTRDSSDSQQGRFSRAVLLPRLGFVFLHAANQPRFAFRKAGERKIDGVKTWEVKYQENGAPTILFTTESTNAPSSGSFWIDPATGQVLQSSLKSADSSALYDEMTVTYALDKTTGLRLPATMQHQTFDNEESRRVQGKATYSKWRFVPCSVK